MGKSKSREHAEHNEQLCNHLLDQNDWYDWVVTTAFYAALHFVDDALFPLEIEGELYSDLDEWNRSAQARDMGYNPHTQSTHKMRSRLVNQYLHTAFAAYQWFSNKCHTGRYIDYRTTLEFAVEARNKLDIIIQECDSRCKKRSAAL